MKNTDIFRDYDMVVSITQKTINDQLHRLLNQGTIRDKLIIEQHVDDNDKYIYNVFDSENKIPKDKDGNPFNSSIAGKITPTIDIQHSGTNVNFVLQFNSGTAYFWHGSGHNAKLKQFDMTGWTYAVVVNLDLKTVEREDIGKGIKVPKFIENQLKGFMDQMFSVNHLFMDFESTDLLRFDPTKTNAGKAGDTGIEQFVTFMQFYLKYLIESGNPYILGYAITINDETQYKQNIPDSLKPVGTTYSMFHDYGNNDNSTLNFVLTTKGGHHDGILGTPGNFDENWISPNDKCEAKMIYSCSRLLEEFILIPFYTQLSIKVRDRIKDQMSLGADNPYDKAKQINEAETGFEYKVNDGSGSDQYVNTYTVEISNSDTGTEIDLIFKGRIYTRKEVSRNMGFCTAEAWASCSVDWSTKVSITSIDSNISVNFFPVTTNTSQDSDKNDCAKAFETIGDILKIFIDIITKGLSDIFFKDLFNNLLDTPIPGIDNLNLAWDSLNNSISTTVMLPAGQVFSFKDLSADKEGNTYFKLMYR